MLGGLKALFNDLLPEETVPTDPEHLKQMAAAALMIEVATIDQHFDDSEMNSLKLELQFQFSLQPETLDELIKKAQDARHDATSLYEFTRSINDEFSESEKLDLVTGMWRVAYADGELDKYEEHIIRRVADLIHLPHNLFIKAKLLARS